MTTDLNPKPPVKPGQVFWCLFLDRPLITYYNRQVIKIRFNFTEAFWNLLNIFVALQFGHKVYSYLLSGF